MAEPFDMTLCVDALETPLGGIGRYAWELSSRLPKLAELSSVRYFGRGHLIDDPGRLLRGERVRRGRGPVGAARGWLARRRLRSTLVHGPNYFLPPAAERGVITVHDLSVFRFPQSHPAARVRQFERSFERSLARAVHLITDTETIRSEVIDLFGIAPAKVTAVPLGVGPLFRPHSNAEMLPTLERLGLAAGRYGLCVSALEPRKKLSELIEAWRRLPARLRADYPLVLTGGFGWRNERIQDQVRRAAGEGWLRHLGYVDEADLPHLYAGAAIFVYASIYEGFGLPPLEAMASGVPVVVANCSCLPEVCGDGALYVDPDDDQAFTGRLRECLEDRELRAQAGRRAVERAKGFTWSRCVDRTVDVYRQALAC